MKRIVVSFPFAVTVIALFFSCASVLHAGELTVSSKESIVVTAPDGWTAGVDAAPTRSFPFETYHVQPPAGRNANCLVTLYDKDKLLYADPAYLKKWLQRECLPYVKSPADLPKVETKELKISGSRAFYANFVDPDLVGKPVTKGEYKTATPIIISLDDRYLIKISIFCDDLNGADYQDAVKIAQSIALKKQD